MPPKKTQTAAEEQVATQQNTASFSDFTLRPEIMQAVSENGFERPSDVQALAIPDCLERRDVRVQAKSGKGKTCIFVLSILHMLDLEGTKKPQCLVLVNTKELALQISDEFKRFAKHLPGFNVFTVIGKTPIDIQQKQLAKQECQVVVGTLGRTMDLIQKGFLDVSGIQHLVIDEADKLITEESSKEQLAEILVKVPDCQKMIFSATFSEEARNESAKILREGFKEVRVDDQNLVLHGLTQHYMEVSEPEKLMQVELLLKLKFTQAIVFARTGERVKTLKEYLDSIGVESRSFVAKMSNEERERLYKEFKRKEIRVIIATDVFQRGVDFEGVNLVVHFDMPKSTDDYLHRSGRAGRFETLGLVVSFVTSDDDRKVLEEIQQRFAAKITQITDVNEIQTEKVFLAK